MSILHFSGAPEPMQDKSSNLKMGNGRLKVPQHYALVNCRSGRFLPLDSWREDARVRHIPERNLVRIAVITDTHANLPALRAAIKAVRSQGYDAIYHTGDAIGIGPCPAECLEILLETPRTFCLVGNHEEWLIRSLPSPRPEWMDDDILQLFQWTYDQIDYALQSEILKWPYQSTEELGGVEVCFLHYPLTPSRTGFLSVDQKPSSRDLDRIFRECRAAIVFFGHYHHPVDERGLRRYINPGALGLGETALARYTIIDFKQGHFTIHHHEVPYDDSELFEYFDNRKVPGRDRIYEMFFIR